jgi:hypothetical protein
MRVIKNKGLIIVLSRPSDTANCPTLNLKGNSVELRDDYNGRIKFKGNLLDAISKL